MKRLMDIHTHAVASGHAYSTVDENLRWAAEQGLPEMLHGVQLLKGIELNILDFDGTIDMDEAVLQRLDLAIASLHMPCIKPGTKKENTQAFLKVMENPYVDIIGHPGDPRYAVDYRELFRMAKESTTLL